MTEKRYYERDYDELYYIIDSHTISEKDFDEQVEYNGYTAFRDSLTGKEIIKLLNENEELKSELNDVGSSFEEQIINLRKENEQLNFELKECREHKLFSRRKLEDENKQLKKVLGAILLEVKRDITNTNQTGEIKVFINPNSFEMISEVLRKYGALKD